MLVSLARLVLIVAAASAGGIGYAVGVLDQPLVPDVKALQAHAQWQKSVAIELEELRASGFEHGAMLVIDARSREDFADKHLAAMLIVNLPPGSVTTEIARRIQQLGMPIVLYCSSLTCDAAELVYRELAEFGGVSDMRIYFPGWLGIEAAGLPTAAGAPPVDILTDPGPPQDNLEGGPPGGEPPDAAPAAADQPAAPPAREDPR